MNLFRVEISDSFLQELHTLYQRETLLEEDFKLSILIAGYNQVKAETDLREAKNWK